MRRITKIEIINTRQRGARLRHGTLPEYAERGDAQILCPKHGPMPGETEALNFWSKGDRTHCEKCDAWVTPSIHYRKLRVIVDLTL